MQSTPIQPDPIQVPPDFDDALRTFYGQVIHPEDMNEVACNLAGSLDDYDVTVDQMEQVLLANNLVTLTPGNARQFAAEAVRLR